MAFTSAPIKTTAPTKIAPKREQTGERIPDAMQKQTAEVASAVNGMPFASGRLLDTDQDTRGKITGVKGAGIPFGSGQVRTLSHGLGRVPSGFWVVDVTAAIAGSLPTFIRSPASAATSTSITIQDSGDAGVAKFWVW